MNRRAIYILSGVLLLAAASTWIVMNRDRNPMGTGPETEGGTHKSGRPAESGSARVPKGDEFALSNEYEFIALRVILPAPADSPWSGPFFNSANCTNGENAEAAAGVLPNWIRQAVRLGESDRAAGYLFSLRKLLGTDNPDIRYSALLALYRLGDTDAKVVALLKRGLEADGELRMMNPLAVSGNIVTLREVILKHIRFYSDAAMIGEVESLLAQGLTKGSGGNAAVDFALFLENAGHPQPDSFWIAQLNTGGRNSALQILARRPPEGFEKMLQDIFKDKENTAAAVVAFQLGYGASYETALVDHVMESLRTGRPEPALETALSGLLSGKSAQGLQLAREALESENIVLHEIALRALSAAPQAEAITLIRKYAEERINSGGFPSDALMALLKAGGDAADESYLKLKGALLSSGQLEHDFDKLEYFRRHRLFL